MGGPVVRHGRRNQSAEHARHRPMIKAATVLRWQGLNLRARDLEQAGRDSPGSWMARRQGYAQLWREGQSDGTLCQGSKAALQFLMEVAFQIDLCWALQQLAVQLAARAADQNLPPGERAAAAALTALAGASWVELRRFPRGGYDLVLCTRTPGGVRRVGLALQTRTAKVNQHWKLEQKERPWFKQQRLGGGLAVLFNGYRLAAATESDVAVALAAAQRRRQAGELNEAELEAEDEGEEEEEAAAEAAALAEELDLAAGSGDEGEDAEALLGSDSEGAAPDEEEDSAEVDGGGQQQEEEQPAEAGIKGQRYFSFLDLPEGACTNIVPFAELLLRLADKVAPLDDPSTWPANPHYQFARAMDRTHSKLLDAAHRHVSTALPDWEVQISAQEIGQQASLLVIPPEGMPLRSLTLQDGLRLSQAAGEVRLDEAERVMQAAYTVLTQLASGGDGASGSTSGSGSECHRKAAEALNLLERARAALALGTASPPLHDGLALLKQCKQATFECLLEAAKQRSWEGYDHEQPAAAGAEEEEEEEQPGPAKRTRRAAAERAAGGITAGVRGSRERMNWEKQPDMLQRFEEAVEQRGGVFATTGKDVWKSMGSPATPTAVQVHGRLDLMRKKQGAAAASAAAPPASEAQLPDGAAAVPSTTPSAGGAAAAAAAGAEPLPAAVAGSVAAASAAGSHTETAEEAAQEAAQEAAGEAADEPPAEHGAALLAAVFEERVGHGADLKMGSNPMPLSALPQPQLAAAGQGARQRAIVLRLLRAQEGRSVKLIDRVGGDSRATLSVRKTLCVQGQAFMLIQDPEKLLAEGALDSMHVNEPQVDEMEVGGAVSGSCNNEQPPLHLLHAAALPYTGLLGTGRTRGGARNPGSAQLSQLAAARVPLSQLHHRLLETLPVSADDAVAACAVQPVLRHLIASCAMLVAHGAGINLAGRGIRSGEGDAWLDSFVPLADAAQQAGLAEVLHAVLRSGLLSITQLHNAIGNMRKPLADAGARLETGAYEGPLTGASDPDSQQQLQQALAAFEAGCKHLGAGHLPGMAGVGATGTAARKQLHERWQGQVEALWPGTAPLFKAVFAAGVAATSVYNRFRRLRGNPATAAQAALTILKRQDRRAP